MWFYFHTQITPTDLILQNDAYFNTEGVFDSDWRSADSIWSLVSDEMLSGVLEEVSKLKKSRKLDAFVQIHDQNRATTGQETFSIARKTL